MAHETLVAESSLNHVATATAMTPVPAPPIRATSRWLRPLTPDDVAKLRRTFDRGLLRYLVLHAVVWAAGGALLYAGLHLIVDHRWPAFVGRVTRAVLPYSVLGIWLGLINWNMKVLGYARWRRLAAPVANPGAAIADPSTVRAANGPVARPAVLWLLIGALFIWFPGDLYLDSLDRQVEAALEDGRPDEVQTEARWLLRATRLYPLGWDHGNAIVHGHVALGLGALEQDDVAAAREHLLEAGHTPGSPQLDTFGPNMLLAKALLERGEREVVLDYFDLCRGFWRMDDGDLDTWSEAVRAGEMPDFGANLRF